MTPIVPRSGRQNVIDITSVLVYDGFALLIPVSDEISSNYEAIIKPFQWPVIEPSLIKVEIGFKK